MNLDQFACQNPRCPDCDKPGKGNINLFTRYCRKQVRLLICKSCGRTFSELKGTPFWDSRLDWDTIVPGASLKLVDSVGGMITRYTTPCRTNARWFRGGDFNRMHQALHPGWSRVYARVIEPGTVRAGDPVLFKPPRE